MERSFVKPSSGVASKFRKKFPRRPGFLTCSSDGAEASSSESGASTPVRGMTVSTITHSCLSSRKSGIARPPPSPRAIPVPTPMPTIVRCHTPQDSKVNTSSKRYSLIPTPGQGHASPASVVLPRRNNSAKKSSSFQSFITNNSSRQPSNAISRHISVIPKNQPQPITASAKSQFYSLQRPNSAKFRAPMYDHDHEMNPDTLEPRDQFIRRSAKPGMDKTRRREYSLRFMIESISQLSSKKRYHCELKLNNRTYARTSSRLAEKGEATWNEIYELCNLSPVVSVTINLYKEMVEGKGDKKKNIRTKIAFVTVPIEELCERNEVKRRLNMQKSRENGNSGGSPSSHNFCLPTESRRLYGGDTTEPGQQRDYSTSSLPRETCSISSARSGSFLRYLRSSGSSSAASSSATGSRRSETEDNGGSTDGPRLCISAKYQCIDILPLHFYCDLRQFVLVNYLVLVRHLDPRLAGRRLEEVASSLVAIHEAENRAPNFIADAVMATIETSESSSVVLRANSIGSKAVESYMKLVGMDFLRIVLGEHSQRILAYPSSLEVDPDRLRGTGSLLRLSQVQLCSMVQAVCNSITSAVHIFPRPLRRVFSQLRNRVEAVSNPELADQLLTGCIFLRLLCPAILNPYLYQLIQEYPRDPRIIRNFTLISKSLQSLANQTGHSSMSTATKEPFMRPILESLAGLSTSIVIFLRQISSDPPEPPDSPCQNIDIGYELAVTHLYFSEIFLPPDPQLSEPLRSLGPVLQSLSGHLTQDSQQYGPPRSAVTNPSLVSGGSGGSASSRLGTRKQSVPNTLLDCQRGSATATLERRRIPNPRHTVNLEEIDQLWRRLVLKAEDHLAHPELLPRFDIDLDPDFHMEYRMINGIGDERPYDDLPTPSVVVAATPASGGLPNGDDVNTTPLQSPVNDDEDDEEDEVTSDSASSPDLRCPSPPPPQPISRVAACPPTTLTKSPIRMGTKAVQTGNGMTKKATQSPLEELDCMRRLVTEAESRYLQARREVEDKDRENRRLRELLRQQQRGQAEAGPLS